MASGMGYIEAHEDEKGQKVEEEFNSIRQASVWGWYSQTDI
jgi:hypothetical protein